MTPTATELWNDIEFIKKRIEEQKQYIKKRWPTPEKFWKALLDENESQYLKTAEFIRIKFKKRLEELMVV